MNINSISELPALEASILSASSQQQLTSVSKAYNDAHTISGGNDLSNLNELGFKSLSCKSMSVEVSYMSENGKLSSCKFDLGKALNNISETLAWIAYLNSSGLTREVADDLYVPYTGNIGEGKKAVSGLHIVSPDSSTTTAATSLSVVGQASFSNSNNELMFEVNTGDGQIKATGCEITCSNVTCSIDGNLSATNAYCNTLAAGLYAVGNSQSWNLNVLSGTNGTYPKSATVNQLFCNSLSSSLLSAQECSANILQAGLSGSTYVFSAGSIRGSIGVSAQAITASNLDAGLYDSSYKLQVLADGNPIEISQLAAENLSAGISANSHGNNEILLIANDDSEALVLKKLRVTENAGLSANGISELTAKAACWS